MTVSSNNQFYKNNAHWFLIGLMCAMFLFLIALFVVLYQMAHKPLPSFHARDSAGKEMVLEPFTEPNLLSDTIIRFATKAAVAAYTFKYVSYTQQIQLARPYFTAAGWESYQNAMRATIASVVAKQLLVTSAVNGTPVISNEGLIPPHNVYAWRIQIPFFASWQTGDNKIENKKYYVILTLIRVPTSENPQGIGVDQFVMVPL